jgi:hypothetical protein
MHLVENLIETWGANTAWQCFALDYPAGHVEVLAADRHLVVVTLGADYDRCKLYSWAATRGQA